MPVTLAAGFGAIENETAQLAFAQDFVQARAQALEHLLFGRR